RAEALCEPAWVDRWGEGLGYPSRSERDLVARRFFLARPGKTSSTSAGSDSILRGETGAREPEEQGRRSPLRGRSGRPAPARRGQAPAVGRSTRTRDAGRGKAKPIRIVARIAIRSLVKCESVEVASSTSSRRTVMICEASRTQSFPAATCR